jgi:hypothetical protein
MKAFLVKRSLINLLAAASQGRYNVIGVTSRKTDAEDIREIPQVTVTYRQGRFDESSSSVNGPYQHEATIRIAILAGAVASMDLAAINAPGATPEQIAAALAASSNATYDADAKAEATIDIIFDTIMQPMNRDLGTDENAGRWIPDIQKDDPRVRGEIVIVPVVITLTYQVTEITTQEVGTPGNSLHHNIGLSADVSGEVPEGQGVQVFVPRP